MRASYQIRVAWVLIWAIAVVLIGTRTSLFQWLRAPISKLVAPIAGWVHDTTASDASLAAKSKEELIAEIEALREQRLRWEVATASASTTARVCADLERAFSLIDRHKTFRPLGANVLGTGMSFDTSLLLIDQGSEAGVQTGDTILTTDGALVGTVHTVTTQSAYIRTLAHPASAISGASVEQGTLVGLVRGQFGLSTQLTLIPKAAQLRQGSLIQTAGMDQAVPAGIVIGSVEGLEEEPNTELLRASIQVRYAQENLRQVIVLTRPAQ